MHADGGDAIPSALGRYDPRRFEEELARDLGGYRVVLSGAGHEKGDVRRPARFVDGVRDDIYTFRAEAKLTAQDAYQFLARDWHDIARSAGQAAEEPLFALRFARARDGLVLARKGLCDELGLHAPEGAHALTLAKAVRLRPGAFHELRVPRASSAVQRPSHEVLLVTPYTTFFERLHQAPRFCAPADAAKHR